MTLRIITLLSLLFSLNLNAKVPDEAEFSAVSYLGEKIGAWMDDLGDKRPKSLAIYYIHANAPLGQDFAAIAETEILKNLTDQGFEKVTSCFECRTPVVTVTDDKIVVSRGTFDTESMKKFGKTQSVQAFLVIELFRTKLNLIGHASLYENPTGTLIAAEKFNVPALNFNDTSVQVYFLGGGGKVFDGKGKGASKLATTGSLMLLEQLGFAKGGLTIGGIFSSGSYLAYLNPTLSFQGRFGHSNLNYGINIGAGYAIATETKGFDLRGGLEFILGNFTVLGIETVYFMPEQPGIDTLKLFGGIHLGIVLGR